MAGFNKKDRHRLQEWATLLFVKEHRSQKEIAHTVGVSEKTIGEWKTELGWEQLRKSITYTKEEQLKKLYGQLEQFNSWIEKKPDGMRFPDTKEADALKKLSSSIKELTTETNVAQTIDVLIHLIGFVRNVDFDKAQEINDWADQYIKSLLK